MADIVRVSSTEFGKEVGRYQDMALSQPVVVTRNGHDRTVMISAEEYQRLKRRDRHVYGAGELPEEMIEAVARSEMDPRHRQLDERGANADAARFEKLMARIGSEPPRKGDEIPAGYRKIWKK